MKALLLTMGMLWPFAVQAEWLIQFENNGKQIVESFERSADGWQDRRAHWEFTDAGRARAFLESRGTSPQSFAAEPDGRELRGLAAGLWTAEHPWTWDWEMKFADWIAAEVNPAFFEKYKVATDCADALYALRWIFARTHKLEMASRLAGSGDYVTHRSLRGSWGNLPTAAEWFNDRRFRAALDYILENTYTHSLMTDSYPIAITREALTEGVYHLDLHRDSGHTQVAARTDSRGESVLPFSIIQSTVPRKIRQLSTSGFWYSSQPKEGLGGLLRMRWPVFGNSVSMTAPEKMPFFSKEQYAANFLRTPETPYFKEVYLRLNPQLDFVKVVNEAWTSVKGMFLARLQIVEDGYRYCRQNGCPPGSAADDDWSTPTRDGRLLELIGQAQDMQMSLRLPEDAAMNVPFLAFNGETYTLRAAVEAWTSRRFSSDPNQSPERRWALSAEGLRQWSSEIVTTSLKDRTALLAAGKNSLESDRKLRLVREQAAAYCASAPKTQCALFRDVLDAPATVALGSEKLSLRQTLARAAWFIGLAGESADRQWGRHSRQQAWADLSDLTVTGFSKNQHVLVTDDSGWRVLRATTEGARTVLEGAPGAVALLLEDAAVLVRTEGSEIAATDLATGLESRASLPFVTTHLLVSGHRVVFMDVPGKFFAIGEWQGQGQGQGPWRWLAQGRGEGRQGWAAKNLWTVREAAGTRYWDLAEASPRSWILADEPALDLGSVLQKWIVFRTDEGDAVLVDREKGTPVGGGPKIGKITCRADGRTCLDIRPAPATHDTAATLYRIEDDGRWHALESRRARMISTDGTLIYLRNENSWIPDLLDWREDKLVAVNPLADEKSVLNKQGEWIVAALKAGKLRLRRGSQTVIEAPQLMLGPPNHGPDFYFYEYQPENGLMLRSSASPQRTLLLESGGGPTLAAHRLVADGYVSIGGIWIP